MDILEYAKFKKMFGGNDNSGSTDSDVNELSEFLKWRNGSYLFYTCRTLTTVPLFDTSMLTDMSYMFSNCEALTTVPLFDTSNVTTMRDMFSNCEALTTVPLFDTSMLTDMINMFAGCTALTTVPLFDTSNVLNMSSVFVRCSALTTVPLFDTSNASQAQNMFNSCTSLTTVPSFDFRRMSYPNYMFNNCTALTDVRLRNIRANLQVGSGTLWGHLLTVDSLTHLIYELRDTGSSKTLTIGSANLEKLANVYVKLVDITDDMRAADDLIDEKLPFVVCESTDEGAALITDYVAGKNWSIV